MKNMNDAQVCLRRGEEGDIRGGKLWIFDNEIDWIDEGCENGSVVEVIDSDYVRLAESKGLYGGSLVRRHVLRNALIPIVTVLAPLIVDLLTGALVVEKIYGINGIGKLMVDAIAGEGVDYNYVLALGILYSSLYIGIMLVVDILYGALDPRIRVAAKGGANE